MLTCSICLTILMPLTGFLSAIPKDYLLTDSELRDPELLPHLSKPNPHKATWNNMMLYVRQMVCDIAFLVMINRMATMQLTDIYVCIYIVLSNALQVEEYAFKKWGSAEGLDAEYERRQSEKKRKKEVEFKKKLAGVSLCFIVMIGIMSGFQRTSINLT
ncbi:XPA protein C-terminus-domain-containing protein [Jimgerdemannia flammicorona]|uniref:XPA protein C-terminus-domain-containing protein n=2 Tax=Jimgerdemannia flammicorona TaxID=994334 RepID=A0A433Q8T7_9FUNG|nr:XPA protein C-terminus-domain-containing protein [Jimgerdemannia flammicorona]RUS26200.1 XPA protein C-terminus-domain-containing protein [Jimgerdemannia flammicorona]